MNSISYPGENRFRYPGWLPVASLIATIIGIIGLIVGLVGKAAVDAWLWLIIFYMIFAGIVHGMLTWSAIFRVTQARWTPAVVRLSQSVIFALPVMYIALIGIIIGMGNFAPWVIHPIPAKSAWLNMPFLAARDLILVGGLYVLFYLLVHKGLEADAKSIRGEAISAEDQYGLTAIGIATILMYAITTTILSIDLIMSLSPEWFSTMFGPYIFMTGLYIAMASIIILAALVRNVAPADKYLQSQQFKDMGNLMLGFSLFVMGLFYAQYLTIWYANIPSETFFLTRRYVLEPWSIPGWTAFAVGYGLPFILLQSRTIKRRPLWLIPICVLAIIGFTFERYVFVAPSYIVTTTLLSPIGGLVFLAFTGVTVLSVIFFLDRYAPISSAQANLPPLDTLETG